MLFLYKYSIYRVSVFQLFLCPIHKHINGGFSLKYSRKEFIQNTGYASVAGLLTLAGCGYKEKVKTLETPSDKKILTDSNLKIFLKQSGTKYNHFLLLAPNRL